MRIALLAALLFLASLAEAAQMPIAALPGGNVIYKPIQSIRERRFADLVQQKTDFSCGAAALATVLKQAYWQGFTITIYDFISHLCNSLEIIFADC